MVAALAPRPRLLRIACVAPCLYLVEHTGGRALYREVTEERWGRSWGSLERAHAEESRYAAHDALDADLLDVATDIICDGRRVPGCEVVL